MTIKNFIFDMGGVLIEWAPKEFAIRSGITKKEDIDTLLKMSFESPTWSEMDKGTIDAYEAHKMLIDKLPDNLKEKGSYAINNWAKLTKPIDGMLDLIIDLKTKGYKIYLLSNASSDHPDYWTKFPYAPYFDGLYVSYEHLKAKPDSEIYYDFLNVFKLNKEECIYIDDMQRNIDAGKKLGITSILFEGDTNKLENQIDSILKRQPTV